MKWIGWGAGQFFQAVFNEERRALARLVDANPLLWGQRVGGYLVEDPALVLPSLDPSDTGILIFAHDKAAEVEAAIARFGPFSTLCMGQVVRTTSSHWSDWEVRRDMNRAMWDEATRESAAYVLAHMKDARHFRDRLAMLAEMVGQVDLPGQILEFGVAAGASLHVIAGSTPRTVHGFDSFDGLPEAWDFVLPKGMFSGQYPSGLPANAQLVVGLFQDTLPGFLAEHTDPVAFLHIDSDLYESARTVFTLLGDRIQRGTLIVFDEYLNFPGWRGHEFRAFQEFITQSGFAYDYLAVTTTQTQVGVRIR